MCLPAGEFMRRFLLHALPDGFHRIRHYGLFANGHRAAMIARCRELLDVPPTQADGDGGQGEQCGATKQVPACPCCGGPMRIIERFEGPNPQRAAARFELTRRHAGLAAAVAVSAVSASETDRGFSGTEEFWIIVAIRSEDETETPGRRKRRQSRSSKTSGAHSLSEAARL